MKKIIYLLVVATLLSACGSSKSGTTKLSKKTLKGTWEVTNIRFVGDKGLYKANLFDIADSPCFKGSEWVFIPNNGSGKFTIKPTSHCDESSHRIHWSIYQPSDGVSKFQFKFVNEKNKPLSGANEGYRANIDSMDETSMVLRVATTYEGNPFDVVLSFTKISDEFKL